MSTSDDFEQAIRRGEERALQDLSAPDDGTVSVSVYRYGDDREDFKLCRTCGWARPGRCRCQASGQGADRAPPAPLWPSVDPQSGRPIELGPSL